MSFDKTFLGVWLAILAWMFFSGPLQDAARRKDCERGGNQCRHIDEWVPTKVQLCVPVPADGGHGVG